MLMLLPVVELGLEERHLGNLDRAHASERQQRGYLVGVITRELDVPESLEHDGVAVADGGHVHSASVLN